MRHHSSAQAIKEANKNNRCAAIGYLTVGYPSYDITVEAGKALIDAGFDVLELGAPYSDPCMDGPMIQRASHLSLLQHIRTRDVFRCAQELSAYGATVMIMTYYNLVYATGIKEYARRCQECGCVGVIIPDLPPEEAHDWEEASDKYHLERTFLVAPSSSTRRLQLISRHTRGWVYAASTMGVTGARDRIDTGCRDLVERTRKAGAQLVCVGFGVKTGQQVHAIGQFADGVIIGSALVDTLAPSSGVPTQHDYQQLDRLRERAYELVQGTYRTSSYQ